MFMTIGQKKGDDVYTGLATPGICANRGVRKVQLYHICERYVRRDDIFEASKLKQNKGKRK
jgi:hypothetical protein